MIVNEQTSRVQIKLIFLDPDHLLILHSGLDIWTCDTKEHFRLRDHWPMHITECNWQKSYFILSGTDAISISSWSPNRFYDSLLGPKIKQLWKVVINQKYKEQIRKTKSPFVYEMNSARKKYILVTWVGGIYWGKEASKGAERTIEPPYL